MQVLGNCLWLAVFTQREEACWHNPWPLFAQNVQALSPRVHWCLLWDHPLFKQMTPDLCPWPVPKAQVCGYMLATTPNLYMLCNMTRTNPGSQRIPVRIRHEWKNLTSSMISSKLTRGTTILRLDLCCVHTTRSKLMRDKWQLKADPGMIHSSQLMPGGGIIQLYYLYHSTSSKLTSGTAILRLD